MGDKEREAQVCVSSPSSVSSCSSKFGTWDNLSVSQYTRVLTFAFSFLGLLCGLSDYCIKTQMSHEHEIITILLAVIIIAEWKSIRTSYSPYGHGAKHILVWPFFHRPLKVGKTSYLTLAFVRNGVCMPTILLLTIARISGLHSRRLGVNPNISAKSPRGRVAFFCLKTLQQSLWLPKFCFLLSSLNYDLVVRD